MNSQSIFQLEVLPEVEYTFRVVALQGDIPKFYSDSVEHATGAAAGDARAGIALILTSVMVIMALQ